MSVYPNHRQFREHIENVAYRLEQGMYAGTYNHQDSSCCVVGLALEDYTGQPIYPGDAGVILSQIHDHDLHQLFNTYGMKDPRSQDEGAAKARTYLAATRHLETVE